MRRYVRELRRKRRVLAALCESLATDGWLALGSAEGVGGLSLEIEAQPDQRFLFRKGAPAPRLRLVTAEA